MQTSKNEKSLMSLSMRPRQGESIVGTGGERKIEFIHTGFVQFILHLAQGLENVTGSAVQ